MDLGLTDKRALVLAASRGLGRGIAEALAAEGARLVMCSRNAEAIREAASDIAARHRVEARAVVCDLGDLAQVDALADAAYAAMGGVDILIGNCGGPPPRPASDVPVEMWRSQFEAMVLSIIRLSERLLPAMRAHRWGRLVLVSSSSVKATHHGPWHLEHTAPWFGGLGKISEPRSRRRRCHRQSALARRVRHRSGRRRSSRRAPRKPARASRSSARPPSPAYR